MSPKEVSDLIDALEDAGFHIPDGVSTVNHLIIAIKAQGSPRGGRNGDDDDRNYAGGDDYGIDQGATMLSTTAAADDDPILRGASSGERRVVLETRTRAAGYSAPKTVKK